MVIWRSEKGKEKVSTTHKLKLCPNCSFVDADESGGDIDLICRHTSQEGLSVGMFDSCSYYIRWNSLPVNNLSHGVCLVPERVSDAW